MSEVFRDTMYLKEFIKQTFILVPNENKVFLGMFPEDLWVYCYRG